MFASEGYTEIANATHSAATVVDQDTCETRLQRDTRKLKAKGQNATMVAKGLSELGVELTPTE